MVMNILECFNSMSIEYSSILGIGDYILVIQTTLFSDVSRWVIQPFNFNCYLLYLACLTCAHAFIPTFKTWLLTVLSIYILIFFRNNMEQKIWCFSSTPKNYWIKWNQLLWWLKKKERHLVNNMILYTVIRCVYWWDLQFK